MEDRYLFKAKTCNGEWVTGFLHCKDGKWYISNKAGSPFAYEVRPDTICQCTGLKDNNGKLIWENDIVKCKYYDNGKSNRHIGQVKYTCEAYKVVGVKQYTGYHARLDVSYEVIGNIFDNPDLLESEENMTESEAKGFVQGKLDCMNKCGIFNKEDNTSDKECDICEYCYSQGNFGEQKEAFQMALQALEKQIPNKPKERDRIGFNTLVCPVCKGVLYLYEPYCDNCGQKLDWSDEK